MVILTIIVVGVVVVTTSIVRHQLFMFNCHMVPFCMSYQPQR